MSVLPMADQLSYLGAYKITSIEHEINIVLDQAKHDPGHEGT